MSNKNKYLTNVYQRIKKICCPEWVKNPDAFYKWYEEQSQQQNDCCIYYGLPGNTTECYGHNFRYGRRGKRLEVDRKESKAPYSPDNCVLACYPCNNAKSDVFTYEDFLVIGKVIYKLKKGL